MRCKRFLFCALTFFLSFLCFPAWAVDVNFTYDDFSSLNSSSGTSVTLALNGNAANNAGVFQSLRVTPASSSQAGTAWTTTTLPFQHFSTNFLFLISGASAPPARPLWLLCGI